MTFEVLLDDMGITAVTPATPEEGCTLISTKDGSEIGYVTYGKKWGGNSLVDTLTVYESAIFGFEKVAEVCSIAIPIWVTIRLCGHIIFIKVDKDRVLIY